MSEASRFETLLSKHLSGVCDLTEPQIDDLYAHYCLFARWNRVINLSSIRDLEQVVLRHYCESLYVGEYLPKRSQSIADLGSGAGFPGVPVAILRPDCHVSLIESHNRKAVFLREATRKLANVVVISKRAEDLAATFDWLISRAVRGEEVLRYVPRLATRIGLLLGESNLDNLLKIKAVKWNEPHPLPWDRKKILLLGRYVPRET